MERERPQPAQACTSPPSEAEPGGKLPSASAGPEALEDAEDTLFSEPVPVQVGASLLAGGPSLQE